jgi:hypothetical protein
VWNVSKMFSKSLLLKFNDSMLIIQNAAIGYNLDPVPLTSYIYNVYTTSSLNLTFHVLACFQNFCFTRSFSTKQSMNSLSVTFQLHTSPQPRKFHNHKNISHYWTSKYLTMQHHVFLTNFTTLHQYIFLVNFVFIMFFP